MAHLTKVMRIALTSRLIVFVLQLFFNHLIPDHKSVDAFQGEEFHPPNTRSDYFVHNLLSGFGNWDARYFISISEYGYKYEQWIAFFPLYSVAINRLQSLLGSVLDLHYPYSHLLAGCLLSNFCFIIAAIFLYKLTVSLHRNKQFALSSVKWFCYNPASIFFSSCYTESIYAAFVFTALFFIHRKYDGIFQHRFCLLFAGLLLTCASFTRSNGITNVLFLLYPVVHKNFLHLVNRCWQKCLDAQQITLFIFSLLLSAFVLLPFLLVQLHAVDLFCNTEQDKLKPLCNQNPLDVYSYVQETYWQVGLFRYYQWKKLPNFLLALPMLLLVYRVIATFWNENRQLLRRNFLNFSSYKFKREDEFWNRIEILLPYLLHCVFLSVFGLLCINVEVITRLLCSSTPLIYWASAAFDKRVQNITKLYFATYFFVGISMHTNFLPWT